ncbi:twin transmembrane helix small protein [Halovulum sp. GXIMD14793]
MLPKYMVVIGLIACLIVLAILAVGVASFGKGGDFNRKYANKIMRMRLAAQFAAVVIIVGMAYFFGEGR